MPEAEECAGKQVNCTVNQTYILDWYTLLYNVIVHFTAYAKPIAELFANKRPT